MKKKDKLQGEMRKRTKALVAQGTEAPRAATLELDTLLHQRLQATNFKAFIFSSSWRVSETAPVAETAAEQRRRREPLFLMAFVFGREEQIVVNVPKGKLMEVSRAGIETYRTPSLQ